MATRNAAKPPRRRTLGPTSRRRGETPAPRLPHERDESADEQGATVGEIGRRAKDDLDRGLTDTDRGPVLERTYDRLKRRRR